MTVRNVALVMWVVLGSCVVSLPLRPQARGGERCPGLRWSAQSEWRTPEGAAMYLSKPAILPMRGGTLWVGPLLTIRRGPHDFIWPLLPLGDTLITRPTQMTIGVLIGRDGPQIRGVLEDTGVSLADAGTMEEAVRTATQRAHAGDAVLMSPACASFDMFRNYEHRAEAFRAAVKALAAEAGVDLEVQA